jgi:hypothetical protein
MNIANTFVHLLRISGEETSLDSSPHSKYINQLGRRRPNKVAFSYPHKLVSFIMRFAQRKTCSFAIMNAEVHQKLGSRQASDGAPKVETRSCGIWLSGCKVSAWVARG